MLSTSDLGEITGLLERIRQGEPHARHALLDTTYARLRAIAQNLLRRERPEHTLEPTALVHEIVVRLLDGTALPHLEDRSHYFAAVTLAMRHYLIDHERKRQTAKRGGGADRVPYQPSFAAVEHLSGFSPLELLDAVEALARVHERASQVVTLRFLAGFSLEETAARLEVSASTVEGDWKLAKAWLRRQLDPSTPVFPMAAPTEPAP